jgi:hypothetical protein
MANEVITEWCVNSIKVYSSYDGKQDMVCLVKVVSPSSPLMK